MQHLFLSLDLNEADSLPLPLYIHSSQKFTQLGSNPISLKCINPHIIRRTWLSQGVLYIKALKYVVKPQQWCTCGTTELWPILTVKQVHELQLWYIQCAALFRLSFLMSPEFQRMYYHASPVGKKTQQLYLDALANTSLCQSRHLPCYHISFPKTQLYCYFFICIFTESQHGRGQKEPLGPSAPNPGQARRLRAGCSASCPGSFWTPLKTLQASLDKLCQRSISWTVQKCFLGYRGNILHFSLWPLPLCWHWAALKKAGLFTGKSVLTQQQVTPPDQLLQATPGLSWANVCPSTRMGNKVQH